MNIAAFDPGRNVGFALLDDTGTLLRHDVLDLVRVAELELEVDVVVVGAGTGSAALVAVLHQRGIVPVAVDEERTSVEGRRLYFRDHPPKGLERLVPLGMRSPPRPIDDYAAYAIGLRYLALRAQARGGGARTAWR